ncbi:MAG: hypothetical protein AAF394_04515, partial [Planctomycetota bacterium]
TMDITKLVSRDLATALVAGLHKARSSDQPWIFRSIEAESTKGNRRLDITVERFEKSSEEIYLDIRRLQITRAATCADGGS